jgi:hypothetical protein
MDRVLARPPPRNAALIAKHGAEFEKVAKHVNDFPRRLPAVHAGRAVPAAAQRHVLRLPALLAAVRVLHDAGRPPDHDQHLVNVGRMGAQEIKDLFGVPSNYTPADERARADVLRDRQDAKHGRLRAVELGPGFNPFLNAVTQLDGMQQAVGLVSPLYQALADQMFHESSFTGQTGGSAAARRRRTPTGRATTSGRSSTC